MIGDAGMFRLRFAVLFIYLMLVGAGSAAAQTTAGGPAPKEPTIGKPTTGKTAFILGVSWQPGFCETHASRPECISQTADRADARQFSLHGLWPLRKSYCGVSAAVRAQDRKGDWLSLPALTLADQTASRLQVAMPGRQSGLDRHQWLRSGTCQGETAEVYFGRQLHLLDQLNASAVQRLFAQRIGQEVTQAEVKEAFDGAFGPAAGDRVRMRCQKDGSRTVISGLTIGLSSDVVTRADRSATVIPAAAPAAMPAVSTAKDASPAKDVSRVKEDVAQDDQLPNLGALILAAGVTDFKCARGIVDAAGFQ